MLSHPTPAARQHGFSLIELLIVVAIIGIIAAIAIPNLLASSRAANEGAATANMRAVSSAEHAYFATKGGNRNYASITELMDDTLLDRSFASDPKGGYVFQFTPLDEADSRPQSFVLSAIPSAASGFGMSGTRRFGASPAGVIFADAKADLLGTHYVAIADLATETSKAIGAR